MSVAEDVAQAITLSGSDPNTPPLALGYTVSTNPAHGTLSGTAPDLTYTPNNGYFGADSFQFTDNNGVQTSSPATVSITVVGTPSSNAQSVTTVEDSAKAISLTGSDPNSPALPLIYSVIGQPSHGTISGTAPDLTYTPDSGYYGTDSFQFDSNDSVATSSPATVAITIIGAPVAFSQSVTTAHDTSLAITIHGSDPNSPPVALTYRVTVSPAHGTLSGTAPDLTYTPDSGYSGADSFQFTDNNGFTTSDTATVSITVTGVTQVTQPPVTNGDSYTTRENTQLDIAAPGVLTNDTPSGAGLTAVLVAGPAHGKLTLSASGSFVYTPALNYTGEDSFTYEAAIGSTLGNTAVVQLTITPSSIRLLPDTSYYTYLRRRRSIDPPRFDFYHPKIGVLIGLEITGVPTTPTTIVPVNKHFNVNVERKLYVENPQQFDQTQAVLGALFQLETPGPQNEHLLPDTEYYTEQQALYESNPAQFQLKNPYLGAIFAIESIEQGAGATAAVAPAQSSSSNSRSAPS